MTILWDGKNYDKFKASIPQYIKTSTCGQCIDTGEIHIFTNIGVVTCKVGSFLVFPPKELIKYYDTAL